MSASARRCDRDDVARERGVHEEEPQARDEADDSRPAQPSTHRRRAIVLTGVVADVSGQQKERTGREGGGRRRPDADFERGDGRHPRADGSRWRAVSGMAVDGPHEETALRRINDVSPKFRFAGAAFDPGTEVYDE